LERAAQGVEDKVLQTDSAMLDILVILILEAAVEGHH
jgi:hypothetical protein